ncbi:Uncharacterised protein [Algoriella xinjiangensis]|uniref:hypothetical protein n=1 Tax=Algoriella xinjiangensis TaxID=684065 RepID=UPI000F63AEC3|nr:hypothetical protein [Algoriella xinjiangensis]VDH16094.1 Uncharacterised protein [Algoriella xinjiangensis]
MDKNLLKLMNEILLDIDNKEWISTSKNDSDEYRNAVNRLASYNLIEEFNKSDWRLTENGHKAIMLGSVESYLNKDESTNVSIDNLSIINGSYNSVNQSKTVNSKKKNNTLEYLSWIAAILGALVTIYGLIKPFF